MKQLTLSIIKDKTKTGEMDDKEASAEVKTKQYTLT